MRLASPWELPFLLIRLFKWGGSPVVDMDHGLLITDTWVMEYAISKFAGVVRGLDRASFFTRNKLMDITRAG